MSLGRFVSDDVLSPRKLCRRGRFVFEDVYLQGSFVLEEFCLRGRFVSEDIFVPPEVLSLWTFCLHVLYQDVMTQDFLTQDV